MQKLSDILEGILSADFDINEADVLVSGMVNATSQADALAAFDNIEQYLSQYTKPLEQLQKRGWWIRCIRKTVNNSTSIVVYNFSTNDCWYMAWSGFNHRVQMGHRKTTLHVQPNIHNNYRVDKPEVKELADAIRKCVGD